ncbi:MAG: hypothetical protein M1819_001483 [Sarea resinae]|nr:MAG: hypothetical protein M1819_001483 [Sarea resinae]
MIHLASEQKQMQRSRCLLLLAPRTLVKPLKESLESKGLLDKDVKIRALREDEEEQLGLGEETRGWLLLTTRVEVRGHGDEVDDESGKTGDELGYEDDAGEQWSILSDREIGSEEVAQVRCAVERIASSPRGHNSSSSSSSSSISTSTSIKYLTSSTATAAATYHSSPKSKILNPLTQALASWLHSLSFLSLLSDTSIANLTRDETISHLLCHAPHTYTIYPPLLLLPENAFTHPHWKDLLNATQESEKRRLWTEIASALHVTHVAINAPIPPAVQSSSSPLENDSITPSRPSTTPNALRSPTHLTPLHPLSFRPAPPNHAPSASDLEAALWITSTQNGIHQTWAPAHTMFSRGNMREKTRLLSLSSLTPRHLGCSPAEISVVDLYAGIGYFSFCYARAGVGAVVGWDLSAWSCEAFRRGALMNGWQDVRVVEEEEEEEEKDHANELDESRKLPSRSGGEPPNPSQPPSKPTRQQKTPPPPPPPSKPPHLTIHHAPNTRALPRLAYLRATAQIPPIRHVNCGLLPTSRASWPIALAALDPRSRGWIHVHENIGVAEIETKACEIGAWFARVLAGEGEGDGDGVRDREDEGEGTGTGTGSGGDGGGGVRGEAQAQALSARAKEQEQEQEQEQERKRIQGTSQDISGSNGGDKRKRTARVEHVERVKSYAPGVWHCVIDICVEPPGTEE